MQVDISGESVNKAVSKFNGLSARRRWFLIGAALLLFATVPPWNMENLPFILGLIVFVSGVLGMVICIAMIVTKLISDMKWG